MASLKARAGWAGARPARPFLGRRRLDGPSLYRVGGLAALAAVAVALVQVGVEVVGVGLLGIPVPADVAGWFELATERRWLAIAELTTLQILVFVLLVPVLLALAVALYRSRPTAVLIATVAGLVGIAVYLASNTSLSLISLADQYAAAGTDSQRSSLLAAGRALFAAYEGTGLHAGSGLMMLAVAALSVAMLRGRLFGRATAIAGLVAAVVSSGYYLAVGVPELRFPLIELGAAFLLVWLGLVGLRLLTIGRLARRLA